MSFVAGVDLSSHAVDVVLLDESSNAASWHRFKLDGRSAWERTLDVRDAMPPAGFWDDVYLAAIETPFPDQQGVLRRVQGAVMASIPSRVLVWEANAGTWKKALGLKGKPTAADVSRVAPDAVIRRTAGVLRGTNDTAEGAVTLVSDEECQNGRDAFCVALWARELNARGIAA